MTKRREAETISVRDANQGFSRLIARVERGARFIVTKNRRVVARIEPAAGEDGSVDAQRRAAIERLDRLMRDARRSQGGWTFKGGRDELHDRSA
jgi:antitoxin (DNA-binding transcriptional repressor) of toxin-antitoxin stability system